MDKKRFALTNQCPLLPYDSQAGYCAMCGVCLTGRQTRWCGTDCRTKYESNHIWALARKFALQRDGYSCVKCRWTAENFDHPTNFFGHQGVLWSRPTLLRDWNRADNWLEVNHITPRLGGGYNMGCAHHVAGLETLCHRCHVKVTTMQRRSRLLAS